MWLQMNRGYLPVMALLAIHVIFWSVSIEKIVGLEKSYYSALALIGCVFFLGFIGLYPFNSEKKLMMKFKNIVVYILLLAWPISCVNTMMQLDEKLFWYPTSHGLWAIAPVFVIAAVAWFKGVRVGEN